MAGGRFCFQLLLHELMAVMILISKRMAAIALGFLLLHSGLITLGDAGGIVQRHCPEKERHALISFKRELIDDFGMLSSWATHHDDVHNKNCCDWRGVLCSYSTGHVIALHLPGYIQQSPYSRILGSLWHSSAQYLMENCLFSVLKQYERQTLCDGCNVFGSIWKEDSSFKWSCLRSLIILDSSIAKRPAIHLL
ncbi:uncharacterized protein LOC131145963 isoform X2 [Malania oleifera]|uniref:uncharacterized protein LOC131145963 isoform X2 n=1 Tax=Malania oleifera TaxID=397392 RepID=UPI0025ADB811|nr:uncharacterized protein LOC131145963 isoform X2 [Malania oleifera]